VFDQLRYQMLAKIDHKHTSIAVASLINRANTRSSTRTARTHGKRHQGNRVTAPLFALVLHKYTDGYKIMEALTESSYIRLLNIVANAHNF
jgi:hypothetical protein